MERTNVLVFLKLKGQMGLERHEGGQIRAEFSLLGELFL